MFCPNAKAKPVPSIVLTKHYKLAKNIISGARHDDCSIAVVPRGRHSAPLLLFQGIRTDERYHSISQMLTDAKVAEGGCVKHEPCL